MTPRDVYTRFCESLAMQLESVYAFVDRQDPDKLLATLWTQDGTQEASWALVFHRPSQWQDNMAPQWILDITPRRPDPQWDAALAKASLDCEALVRQLPPVCCY